MNARFRQTIASFDQENATDPNMEEDAGIEYPKELLYARRMSACLLEFEPQATEVLQLAVRCQHIRRWQIPRNSYPEDRKGYLLWRSKLKEMHAKVAGEIMESHGYENDTIDRVRKLLLKKGLKTDPEVQVLEDVICIVFLKYYFKDFAIKHDSGKLKNILLKTLNKMSDKGIAHAKSLPDAQQFLTYLA